MTPSTLIFISGLMLLAASILLFFRYRPKKVKTVIAEEESSCTPDEEIMKIPNHNIFIPIVSRDVIVNNIINFACCSIGNRNLSNSIEWIISKNNEYKKPGFYRPKTSYKLKATIILFEQHNTDYWDLIETTLYYVHYHYMYCLDVPYLGESFVAFQPNRLYTESDYETDCREFVLYTEFECMQYLVEKGMLIDMCKANFN